MPPSAAAGSAPPPAEDVAAAAPDTDDGDDARDPGSGGGVVEDDAAAPLTPSLTRSMSHDTALNRTGGRGAQRRRWAGVGPDWADARKGGGAREPVLTGQVSGELSELSAALEALGTPLEGVTMEVAGKLQQKLTKQEGENRALALRCATAERARAEATEQLQHERERAAALEARLAAAVAAAAAAAAGSGVVVGGASATPPGTPPPPSELPSAIGEDDGSASLSLSARSDGEGGGGAASAASAASSAAAGTEGLASAAAVQLTICLRPPSAPSSAPQTPKAGRYRPPAAVEGTSPFAPPLAREVSHLEAELVALQKEHDALLHGVSVAMSCLPPPGPQPAATAAAAAPAQGGGGGGGGGGEPSAMERSAADLASSARQAAHANARLGHAHAAEREAHKGTLCHAQRRVTYLAADLSPKPVSAERAAALEVRLLFSAQPERHAPHGGAAFAALLIPTPPSGAPSHWLSPESLESLQRWCDVEHVPITSLRAVVGRLVHVSEARVAADEDGANPFCLPLGATYHVVHAEMLLQHRWG